MAVIEAQGLSKRFLLQHDRSVELKVRFLNLIHRQWGAAIEEFWALRDVTLRIERGDAVGLVGRNGSGKSTLLKLIAAIHRPTEGRVLVARHARIASMIELGVGFQPELSGRENVFLNAAIQGLSRREIERIYDAIVEYSGLEHFMDVPIKKYSSGMYMRLGFAIVANLEPDILLLDEIFAVGDAQFQQRCIATVRRFLDDGRTLLFVSHSPDAVRAICRRVCVLEHGTLTFDGGVDEGLAFYESTLTVAPAAGGPAPEDKSRVLETQHDQMAVWQFEFLLNQGLRPVDYVVEVAADVPSTPDRLIRFLGSQHRYWGGTPQRVAELPYLSDVAIANSLLPTQSVNALAATIANVMHVLKPSGRFYATWHENTQLANVEPVIRSSGVTSYPDRPPYHYPFGLIQHLCASVGATVERLGDANHPKGESVLVIRRAADQP
jgi:ABC-type polysaccharide/polyol phosphate transport system ATPase subunit